MCCTRTLLCSYIAAHSESLAMSVIVSNGVQQLANALAAEQEDHIQSAICWTIGQVGRHTPEHAKAIAQANLLLKLLRCYMRTDASDDLQSKACATQNPVESS